MKHLRNAICLALAMAGGLAAQVAGQANSGYQTEQQRKNVAQGLADPARDEKQKPGDLIRVMGLQPGMTVADVGTGVGYMLPFLSRRVGPEGKVLAEDIFDDFLSAAKQHAEDTKLANVTFIKGTDTDPKLPEGGVDVVLALDVYHHFDYPDKMLAVTHIRLDMPDVIKEIESNHFHLLSEREHIPNSQYVLVLRKN